MLNAIVHVLVNHGTTVLAACTFYWHASLVLLACRRFAGLHAFHRHASHLMLACTRLACFFCNVDRLTVMLIMQCWRAVVYCFPKTAILTKFENVLVMVVALSYVLDCVDNFETVVLVMEITVYTVLVIAIGLRS